jgi:release factor glutamine methyltransferase
MTLQNLENHFLKSLAPVYPQDEIRAIFKLLCEDLLNFSVTQLMINKDEPLNHLQTQLLEKSLEQLKQNVPVQHITGKAHFYGHEFSVNEHVLIPRQETEELVDWIIRDHQGKPPRRILEIGTGSGCINISLGHAFAKAELSSTDVSGKAHELAKVNANRILPNQNIRFIEQDILATNQIDFYEVIVSNPPYVREFEKVEIHRNVLEHEPATALFVSDTDPLIFYRKILELAKSHKKTLVYFEINQYLKTEMEALAKEHGFESEIRKDLNQNWRMMKCWQSE